MSKVIKQFDLLGEGTGDQELDQLISLAGYSYEPNQDIFISNLYPWQRNVGYCHLYDEAAAPLGMIIDSEPIYFEYQGKKWMIGIWKGQYDLVTGAEIGVYTRALELSIPGVFKGNFYNAANDSEMLEMSFILKKNNKVLFTREGKHWWLTGFILGEFSEPSELTMDICITLKDKAMCEAFIEGLKKTGYQEDEFTTDGLSVCFTFDEPYTPQAVTRTQTTDKLIQRKNQLLCETYREITGPYLTIQEKIRVLKAQDPALYDKFLSLGKNQRLFEIFITVILLGSVLITKFSSLRNKSEESTQNNDELLMFED